MAIEILRTVFSWTNTMDTDDTVVANGDDITFLGQFDAPVIPDSDGDLEKVIAVGDRLDRLALEAYGEQLLWWVIAVRNGYDLPDANLVVGEKIIIPDSDLVKARFIRN